jgi:2-polyprenylphenol 6-hydroxylase
MRETTDFAVAIIGSGPNGATAAALLARQSGLVPERIALIAPDVQSPPAPASGAPQLRVAALARTSEHVLQHAGAWDRLDAQRICRYERMRVWHESMPPDGIGTLQFDAAELAQPDLGCIVENSAVLGASLASFRAAGGTLRAASLKSLEITADAATLHLSDGVVRAQLVVGADGAHSAVRKQLGFELREHDYHQQAIVATIATARPHQHTAWQRFLGTGPLALLPLFDGTVSIVWSADEQLAAELMGLSAEEFALRLDEASDLALGRTRLLSERLAVPLRRASTARLIAPRAALLGDAAHVIHPLAGQGVNLGLLDAAALCEAVSAARVEGEDPGAARVLRRFEQQRLTHDLFMGWAMSAFNEAFSRSGALGWLGARALEVAAANPGIRRAFAARALGLSGDVPRYARRAA